MPRIKNAPLLLLVSVCVGTVIIYYPALDSRFILDDYYNLIDLSFINRNGYNYYILSGMTALPGRPLSLLTFALQYNHWPKDPFAFKLVNLIIHLINGILVYLLTTYLAPRLGVQRCKAKVYAVLVTALWLLHPMQLSTVLYVVQRMNMLAVFFVLTGILGYLYFREKLIRGDARAGFTGMSLCVAVSLVLGILSKENAILLPLFILLIEFMIVPEVYMNVKWRVWAWIFLISPIVFLALYLSHNLGSTIEAYSNRHYTMGERLLTQPIVLLNYMQNIFFPRLGAYGLYNDDFTASGSLFTPIKTIFSITAIVVIIFISILERKKIPVIAFGFLWFFLGHSLESSHLNLELYFEHRNYLPLLGAVFIMTGLAIYCHKYINTGLFIIFIFLYFGFTLFISYSEAKLWSNPFYQAVEWARIHPKSLRALDNLGSIYLKLGEIEKAKKTFHRINKIYPLDIYPDLKQITITHCVEKLKFDANDWNRIYSRAGKAKYNGTAVMAELDGIVGKIEKDKCSGIDVISLMRLIIILAHNPEYGKYKAALHQFVSLLAIHIGDAGSALVNINETLKYSFVPGPIILKLKILIAMGNKNDAGSLLQRLKNYLKGHPKEYLAYNKIIKQLEEKISKINS